jgi:protein SCO1/2
MRAAAFALALLVGTPSLLQAADKDSGKPLPVIGPAPPFELTSQNNKPVKLADFRGKVLAVTFIYTHCPDICPLLTQKMVDVQNALGVDFGPRIAFVSITLDPERDTPEVLKDFAEFWGTKPAGWFFLTGPLDAIRNVTRGYGVYAQKQKDGSIDHTELTSLIDPEGRIRVQYAGYRFDPDEFRHDLLSLVHSE